MRRNLHTLRADSITFYLNRAWELLMFWMYFRNLRSSSRVWVLMSTSLVMSGVPESYSKVFSSDAKSPEGRAFLPIQITYWVYASKRIVFCYRRKRRWGLWFANDNAIENLIENEEKWDCQVAEGLMKLKRIRQTTPYLKQHASFVLEGLKTKEGMA